jgi:DNA recombination protein RmuC
LADVWIWALTNNWIAVGAGIAVAGVVLVVISRLRASAARAALVRRLETLEREQERTQQVVREEIARNRDEARASARDLREEVGTSVKRLGDSVTSSFGELGKTQKIHLDMFSSQIEAFAKQLFNLTEMNEKKLDEMRQTVDEHLQGTLEKRLGEAFKLVSDRLEAVHRGLGDMQKLAADAGDLKRVLTNVKTRGTWGEVQLGSLLDQVLTPDQYQKNVATRKGSPDRVEFAIRLPGRSDDVDEVVWLPIDAKFPQEDYQRLLLAEERADAAGIEEASKQLESRVRASAREITQKYVSPPETTDFAILFLPTEGLYAEVLRRPGLAEKLQTEARVLIAGPTTLAALLNSLQMGFRTLAIEKRSSEVWKLLGALKNQFGQFSGMLQKVQAKLNQASNTIEDAARKSRGIESRLRKVEELPSAEATLLLPELGSEDADPAEEEDDV